MVFKASLVCCLVMSSSLWAGASLALSTSIGREDLPLSARHPVADALPQVKRGLPLSIPDLSPTDILEHEGESPVLMLTIPGASTISQADIGLVAIGLAAIRRESDILGTLQKAIARLGDAGPLTLNHPSIVTQEIHYQMHDAGEVTLVWGINGWKRIDEGLRPPGTRVLDNGGMQTPMAHEGDTFIAKVQVPYGAEIDYGFWIAKTRTGTVAEVWDGNGYPPLNYLTTARGGRPAVVQSTIKLKNDRAPVQPLVTRQIIYRMPSAGDVTLLWGINGWHHVDELIRPAGTTVLKEGVMATRMSRDEENFVARVSVPIGSTVDYRFWITKTRDGGRTDVIEKDGQNDFHMIAKQYGGTTVVSHMKTLP